MSLTELTQVILLLTARFAKSDESGPKTLSPTEWSRFSTWLDAHSLAPEELLLPAPERLLKDLSGVSIEIERIVGLLRRGPAMAFVVERWQRAGLWILTHRDRDYPPRLNQRLENKAPPVLFGCGPLRPLAGGGVAVVGSRNAQGEDLNFSRELGSLAASQGTSIISGAARGVDETSMHGALDADGTAIGMIGDSLLRKATSTKFREFIQANNLTLVSPFQPEANFSVGNAMARNKLIYCLSDAAVIVHSNTKGGTWSGAIENLKNNWVPLWVKVTDDETAGNTAIVDQGGNWLPSPLGEIELATLRQAPGPRKSKLSLFGQIQESRSSETSDTKSTMTINQIAADDSETSLDDDGFYQLFLAKVRLVCRHHTPMHLDDLATTPGFNGVRKDQLRAWLDRAVAEGRMKKPNRSLKYEWIAASPTQRLIFDDL